MLHGDFREGVSRPGDIRSLADRLSSFFTPPRDQKTAHPILWLFVASFAALYLEIMLIRWVSTEVRIFAYFQNLALIACFLGFGIGCFYAQQRRSVVFSIFAMTALVVLVQLQGAFAFWKGLVNSLTSILSISPDLSCGAAFVHRPRGRKPACC